MLFLGPVPVPSGTVQGINYTNLIPQRGADGNGNREIILGAGADGNGNPKLSVDDAIPSKGKSPPEA